MGEAQGTHGDSARALGDRTRVAGVDLDASTEMFALIVAFAVPEALKMARSVAVGTTAADQLEEVFQLLVEVAIQV